MCKSNLFCVCILACASTQNSFLHSVSTLIYITITVFFTLYMPDGSSLVFLSNLVEDFLFSSETHYLHLLDLEVCHYNFSINLFLSFIGIWILNLLYYVWAPMTFVVTAIEMYLLTYILLLSYLFPKFVPKISKVKLSSFII